MVDIAQAAGTVKTAKTSIVAVDDPRLVFLPYEDGIVPPIKWNYLEQMANRWWVVNPKTKAFVFWDPNGGRKSFSGQQIRKGTLERAVPQCNPSNECVKSIIARMYPWAEAEWYERVFRPIDPQEWMNEGSGRG